MGRRANGEGSIFKGKNGEWRGSLVVGRKGKGKLDRRYRRGATRAEVVAKLEKLKVQRSTRKVPAITGETVEEHTKAWLGTHVKAHFAESTHAQAEAAAEGYIYPANCSPHENDERPLGQVLLRDLTVQDIQTWIDRLILNKAPSRMRQVAYTVLQKSLSHAFKLRKITELLMVETKKPKHVRKDIFPFEADEASQILTESHGERGHLAIVLGLTCGMRIGEILGLPRKAIDLEAEELHIYQQAVEVKGTVTIKEVKTKSSRRTIHLPRIAIRAIREHYAMLMLEGNAGHDLMYPAPRGGLERRTNFTRRAWKTVLKRLKLTVRGFHHARHTCATLRLNEGEDVRIVSKLLGHAKTSTTWDTYGHLVKGQFKKSVDSMNRLFG